MGNPIMAQRPELEKLVGKGNAPMAEDNNRNLRPLYVIAVYRLWAGGTGGDHIVGLQNLPRPWVSNHLLGRQFDYLVGDAEKGALAHNPCSGLPLLQLIVGQGSGFHRIDR